MGCIFCAIAAGDVPSARLYEDGRVFAFLDIQPLTPGHALVVPKQHATRLGEADADTQAAVIQAGARLAPVLARLTGAPDTTFAIHDGPAAGQEVPHVHLHVVPRRAGDGGGPVHALFRDRPAVGKDELAHLAQRVRERLEAA